MRHVSEHMYVIFTLHIFPYTPGSAVPLKLMFWRDSAFYGSHTIEWDLTTNADSGGQQLGTVVSVGILVVS